MKVGLIEFGNGIIMEDGVTVSPAMNIHTITSEISTVSTAIGGMVQKKGFTNMAQAFALAETMYTSTGRKGAQSAILVITDGKPSFQFQTNELVEQLDDKGVSRFFVVIGESEKDLDLMKKWASAPWETNLLHVPGLAVVEADESIWAQKALTFLPFCNVSLFAHSEGDIRRLHACEGWGLLWCPWIFALNRGKIHGHHNNPHPS